VSDLIVKEKRCAKCGTTKALSEFYRNAASSDGHRHQCKKCALAHVRDYQARKRSELGEEAWLEKGRTNVAMSRARGATQDKVQQAAWAYSNKRLREMYPKVWEQIYREERYARGLNVR